MSARTAKRLTILGLVLVAGGIAVWLVVFRDNISESNFKRMRDGMTLAEAEELVGQPSVPDEAVANWTGAQLANRWGEYVTPRLFLSEAPVVPHNPKLTLRVWAGDGQSITVVLDQDGKVRGAGFWSDNPKAWWRQVQLMLGL